MVLYLRALARKFNQLETPRLAAALAFYLTVLFAPLLLLFVTIAATLSVSLVAGLEAQLARWAGRDAAEVFHSAMEYVRGHFQWTSWHGIVGFLFLLVLSSLIFGELRWDLNKIFGFSSRPAERSFWLWLAQVIRDQLSHIGLVLGFVLFLFVSLLGSTILNAIHFGGIQGALIVLDILGTWIFYAAAFILMIRFVPDVKQGWARAIKGGVLIAMLFTVGKEVISFYLARVAMDSAYGPAGPSIAFLAWVYYSATIIFLGAEAVSLLDDSNSRSNEVPNEPDLRLSTIS